MGIDAYMAKATLRIDKDLNVTGDTKSEQIDPTMKMGKNFDVTLSDALTIGGGGRVGPVRARASVNLYNIAVGGYKVFASGLSYVNDYINNILE